MSSPSGSFSTSEHVNPTDLTKQHESVIIPRMSSAAPNPTQRAVTPIKYINPQPHSMPYMRPKLVALSTETKKTVGESDMDISDTETRPTNLEEGQLSTNDIMGETVHSGVVPTTIPGIDGLHVYCLVAIRKPSSADDESLILTEPNSDAEVEVLDNLYEAVTRFIHQQMAVNIYWTYQLKEMRTTLCPSPL